MAEMKGIPIMFLTVFNELFHIKVHQNAKNDRRSLFKRISVVIGGHLKTTPVKLF